MHFLPHIVVSVFLPRFKVLFECAKYFEQDTCLLEWTIASHVTNILFSLFDFNWTTTGFYRFYHVTFYIVRYELCTYKSCNTLLSHSLLRERYSYRFSTAMPPRHKMILDWLWETKCQGIRHFSLTKYAEERRVSASSDFDKARCCSARLCGITPTRQGSRPWGRACRVNVHVHTLKASKAKGLCQLVSRGRPQSLAPGRLRPETRSRGPWPGGTVSKVAWLRFLRPSPPPLLPQCLRKPWKREHRREYMHERANCWSKFSEQARHPGCRHNPL